VARRHARSPPQVEKDPGSRGEAPMNTFELNKILGAFLGALTFAFGLAILSELLFMAEAPARPGLEIVIKEAGSDAAAPKAAAVPIEQLFQTASVEKGANVAKKCAACHNFQEGGGNKVGPNLYGIVGHDVAAAPGFAYSAAMKAKGGTWTALDLNHFLTNPKAAVPGTAMAFAGLPKDSERADLIAYLNSLSHSPKPLPTAAAAPAGDAPKAQ